MTREQVLDLYFLDARHKLIELAAFLDRVERAPASSPASTRPAGEDFRLRAFRKAIQELSGRKKQRAKRVQMVFSDKTTQPVAKAGGKGAGGAYSK